MKKIVSVKRAAAFCMAVLMAVSGCPFPKMGITAKADYVDISGNHFIHTDKAPSGKTGKVMSLSLIVTNYDGAFDEDENIYVSFSPDNYLISDPDEEIDDGSKWRFPFEVDQDMFTNRKKVGKLKDGHSKTVSISARVRRDLTDGYYPVYTSSRIAIL